MKNIKLVLLFLISFFVVADSRVEAGILGDFVRGFQQSTTGEDIGEGAAAEYEAEFEAGTEQSRSLLGGLVSGVANIQERAKRAYTVVKGLGIALLKIVLRVNLRAWYLRYYQRYIRIKADIKIDERQEYELEYDLGFSYGGEITRGFRPVKARILMTEPIEAGGFNFEPDSIRFFNNCRKKVRKWKRTYMLIPFASLVLRGVDDVLEKMKNLMRWRPETVFMVKLFALMKSAVDGEDPMTYSGAALQIPILLHRLAISIDEESTIKANRGERNPRKWQVKLYFKDRGIRSILEKDFLKTAKVFLSGIKIKIKQRLKTERIERAKVKGLTQMERAYSTFRRTKGYLKQTVYFIEELLPLLDKIRLDRTDQELFIKAIRVHTARRHRGILNIFKMTGAIRPTPVASVERSTLAAPVFAGDTGDVDYGDYGDVDYGDSGYGTDAAALVDYGDYGDVDIGDEEFMSDTVEEAAGVPEGKEASTLIDEIGQELALTKAVVEYRGLMSGGPVSGGPAAGLVLMLQKAKEKMEKNAGGNRFSLFYRNVVGAITAQIAAEGARLQQVFHAVDWEAQLPEGQTLDDIGKDEDLLSFAKHFTLPKSDDFPFGLPSRETTDEFVDDLEDDTYSDEGYYEEEL